MRKLFPWCHPSQINLNQHQAEPVVLARGAIKSATTELPSIADLTGESQSQSQPETYTIPPAFVAPEVRSLESQRARDFGSGHAIPPAVGAPRRRRTPVTPYFPCAYTSGPVLRGRRRTASGLRVRSTILSIVPHKSNHLVSKIEARHLKLLKRAKEIEQSRQRRGRERHVRPSAASSRSCYRPPSPAPSLVSDSSSCTSASGSEPSEYSYSSESSDSSYSRRLSPPPTRSQHFVQMKRHHLHLEKTRSRNGFFARVMNLCS
ncbi:hypothetical protein FB45DRAFT_928061 [Roridomyces roridus]|uniref:Uncharacterized protein n=1 Tax=Roridomyces roridus TaxID=1738132 RepID=A0AAD7BH67_9AGAR|nr:hypothetical protein FB45DRAFT_928061 [Roridomyces roridus]